MDFSSEIKNELSIAAEVLNNSRAIPPLHVVVLIRLTATVVVFAVVVLSFLIHLYFFLYSLHPAYQSAD